jgi:hypothetical protein
MKVIKKYTAIQLLTQIVNAKEIIIQSLKN